MISPAGPDLPGAYARYQIPQTLPWLDLPKHKWTEGS